MHSFDQKAFFDMAGESTSVLKLSLIPATRNKGAVDDETKKSSVMEMRRAVSYCEPHTTRADADELPSDEPRLVHTRSTTQTGKHRRLLQA